MKSGCWFLIDKQTLIAFFNRFYVYRGACKIMSLFILVKELFVGQLDFLFLLEDSCKIDTITRIAISLSVVCFKSRCSVFSKHYIISNIATYKLTNI